LAQVLDPYQWGREKSGKENSTYFNLMSLTSNYNAWGLWAKN